MNRNNRQVRAGFTLVELLVVITIIGILASLITVAAVNAMWSAKQTKMKVEVDNLATAMEAFKNKYGAYPPADLRDPANNAALRAFVAKAFPRYNLTLLAGDLASINVDTSTFNPANALVFWLSGVSPDVTKPFGNRQNDATNPYNQRTPFFEFDKTRLLPLPAATVYPGQQVYKAQYGDMPYVYFDYRNYDADSSNPGVPKSWGAADNTAVPYVLDVNSNGTVDPTSDSWASPDKFQIICAGQDGNFGNNTSPRLYPTGTSYGPGDADNVTNFCERNNLEDAKP